MQRSAASTVSAHELMVPACVINVCHWTECRYSILALLPLLATAHGSLLRCVCLRWLADSLTADRRRRHVICMAARRMGG